MEVISLVCMLQKDFRQILIQLPENCQTYFVPDNCHCQGNSRIGGFPGGKFGDIDIFLLQTKTFSSFIKNSVHLAQAPPEEGPAREAARCPLTWIGY